MLPANYFSNFFYIYFFHSVSVLSGSMGHVGRDLAQFFLIYFFHSASVLSGSMGHVGRNLAQKTLRKSLGHV